MLFRNSFIIYLILITNWEYNILHCCYILIGYTEIFRIIDNLFYFFKTNIPSGLLHIKGFLKANKCKKACYPPIDSEYAKMRN